jgi:hypothetical protein
MLPAVYDLELYRGDTVRMQLELWHDAERTQPLDLDGAVVASQIRLRPDAEPILNFIVTISLPNAIDLLLVTTEARELPKKGVWDMQITFVDGDVLSPIAGAVRMKPDVTITNGGGP